MTEELFVFIDETWQELDLSKPSNITFDFKSTLFSDITKITSCKTYTFTLPNTANNNQALQHLNDLRHTSSVLGAKLPCIYKIDGMQFIKSPYLYISQVAKDKSYRAVMSWGGIIMDEDIDINEIYVGSPSVGGVTNDLCSWDIFKSNAGADGSVFPFYSCGVPSKALSPQKEFYKTGSFKFANSETENFFYHDASPLPCITVHSIIEQIGKRYNLDFAFNKEVKANEWDSAEDVPDIIKRGVVPITDGKMDKEKVNSYSFTLKNVTFWIDDVSDFGFRAKMYLAFNAKDDAVQNDTPYVDCIQEIVNGKKLYTVIKTNYDCISTRIEGKITIRPDINADILKTLHIVDRTGKNETKDVDAEISGTYYTYNLEGENAIQFDNGGEFYFTFDKGMYYMNQISIDGSIKVIPSKEVLDSSVQDWIFPWKKLPHITCKDFMKSIFFIAGGFPVMEDEGKIQLVRYNQIQENIANGKINNWTRYLIDKNDVTIKYSDGSLGITNYYLMKNENVDSKTGEEKDSSVYETQYASFPCDNMSLNAVKTIIQLPYYSRFLKDTDNPTVETGSTFQYYKLKDGKLETKEPKPSIGMLDKKRMYDRKAARWEDKLIMETWRFPADFAEDNKYYFLANMLKNPQYIECKASIPIINLAKIDFTIPIYLEQFNSLFVLTDLKYSSKNGISTLSLMKITDIGKVMAYGVPVISNVITLTELGERKRAVATVTVFNSDNHGGGADGKFNVKMTKGEGFAALTDTYPLDSGSSIMMDILGNDTGSDRDIVLEVFNAEDESQVTTLTLTQPGEVTYGKPFVGLPADIPAIGLVNETLSVVKVTNTYKSGTTTSGRFNVYLQSGQDFVTITSPNPQFSNATITATVANNQNGKPRTFSIKVTNADDETKYVTLGFTQQG